METPALDGARLQSRIDELWEREIVGCLKEYIAIPAKSPAFDPRWEAHGHLDLVVRQTAAWIEAKRVTFHPDAGVADGWNAAPMAPWYEQALHQASQSAFGAPCAFIGQGGGIPLMGLLQRGFPRAQLMVCGVLGPRSNAHGPNEFLHVPYARRLTAAVARVIACCP